jgi:hypothetical protein
VDLSTKLPSGLEHALFTGFFGLRYRIA